MRHDSTEEHFMKVISIIEDERGYDMPHVLKKDMARICVHLASMNPKKKQPDEKWTVHKVIDFLHGRTCEFEDALNRTSLRRINHD
jgi:hypothetical protein